MAGWSCRTRPQAAKKSRSHSSASRKSRPPTTYPEGYYPELLTEWPVDSDLVISLEDMPPAMLQGMGQSWRERQAYKKHISEITAEE
jgi:hypothetical protein